jgi:aminoglycoside/choline kinase family phosphotransferase
MDTSGIKQEEKRSMKDKCESIVKKEAERVVKEETNDAKAASCLYAGSKVKLTEIPTGKGQHKLGPHQFATQLLNSEVNLISDWAVEHKPQKLSNKGYKHRTTKTLKFVFQEDPKVYLVRDTVKVNDDISQKESGIIMKPLDGAQFLSLLD